MLRNLRTTAARRMPLGIACLVLLGAMGCGSRESRPPKPPANDRLVGTWEVLKSAELAKGSTVEFTADGRITASIKGEEAKFEGTYKVDKDKLKVKLKNDDSRFDDSVSISKLTEDILELKNNGKTDVYKRVKPIRAAVPVSSDPVVSPPPVPASQPPVQPQIRIAMPQSKLEPRFVKPVSPAVISERITTEIPYPTENEADARTLEEAQRLIEKKLKELDPPVDYVPSAAVVKNEYVKRDSRLVRLPNDSEKSALVQAGYPADRKYVEYTVEVTADQIRELRTRNRVADGLRGLGVIAAISLAGFCFLRLDEWTKGYLTSWLAVGAAAVGGGVIAAVMFA